MLFEKALETDNGAEELVNVDQEVGRGETVGVIDYLF